MALTVLNKINPIKCTGTTAADQEILDNQVTIKFIRWYNATTAGDLCHLTDKEGNSILHMRAGSDNDTQIWPMYLRTNGIHCDDMDSGTLYIHIR